MSRLAAAAWLFSALCATATCQTTEDQIEQSFRAGQQALQQHEFAHAVEEFKKVLALDPTIVEAEINLGLAYQSLLEYDLAVRHLEKGLRQRSDLLGPTVIVGMDYLKMGSPEKAIPYLRQALKLDPSNREAREALASAYLGKGDFGSAADQFRQIAQLDSDQSEALFKLGHQYLDLAARLAYRGAHLYPDSAWGHRFLGDLLFQRERWEDAAKEYQKALAIAPKQAGLHTALGNTYLKQGKKEEAAAELRLESKANQSTCCVDSLKASAHLSTAHRLMLGKSYFAAQKYEAAADVLAQVQGVNRDNEEASYWLERTYQAQGAEAYARLQESFPDSWRTHQLRAEGDALRQNFDGAVKELQTALELRPNEPELHDALGEVYFDSQDNDNAESELKKALALDPSRTHALYLLGRLYIQQRETEKALPYLERALRLQPDLAEANSLLGTAYLRMGQYSKAIPKLQKAAATDHYGNVHYQLYEAYRKLGQPELAKKELALSQHLRQSYLERDQAVIMGSPQAEAEPQ